MLAPAFAENLEVVDLASSTAWTLSVDGGAARSIIVPGRGYNAQGISATDNVLYQRSITIPASAAGKVVKVRFGAVNYGADVSIDNTLITSHRNICLPFEADLTGKVTAGSAYTLKVKAYTNGHYQDRIPHGTPGWTALSLGITRYVRLVVLPQVYIKDIFIQPSVKKDRLVFDVQVHNASAQAKPVTLDAALSSWNNAAWPYAAIPAISGTIPAGAVATLHGEARWGLGPQSYWWPNVPFREDYAAQLHNLRLAVKEGAVTLDTAIQRFGFVEYGEGPYYYLVNGVRIGCQPSDGTAEGQFGYSAYTDLPAFQPPTGPGTGLPETFRRYMRLGVNTNRTHASIPPEYMMNVADEMGFWLVPESAIRGFGESGVWDSAAYTDNVREMVLTCRDHPSICRYSLANEYNGGDYLNSCRMLIDAAHECDTTRPFVFEGVAGLGRVNGLYGHAYHMAHYTAYRTWPLNMVICGMGEYAWNIGGRIGDPAYCGGGDLMREGDIGKDMRKRNLAYFAIWTIPNYWPNFLQGMNAANYFCCSREASGWAYAGDRTDNVNGWGSEQIRFLQRSLDPYLAADSAIDEQNLAYTANWPTTVPSYAAGSTISRRAWVFNGGCSGNRMGLFWDARWDGPTGAVAAAGAVDTMTIEPGFNTVRPVTFVAPATGAAADTVAVQNGGTVKFKEDRVYFTIAARKLYFIMKSVLYPPVKRFGLSADSIAVGGSDPVSRAVSVAWADAGLPALTVSSKPSWIAAQISGQGGAQTIGVSLAAGTLTSGIYRGVVTVTVAGFAPVSLTVIATIDGPAHAARLAIAPVHAAALPGGTTKFSAQAFDQFGKSIAATIDWSVAAGGVMDAAGTFTSSGVAGVFQISAAVHGDTAVHSHAQVEVAAGKPVPAGWLTEMLSLTEPSNSPYILFPTMADQIEATFTNPDNPAPCNKQVVPAVSPITGGLYPLTWNAMTDTSGTWAEAGKDYFIAYWAITVLNPTSRKIKLVTRHDEALAVWLNGAKIIDAPGIAATDATSAAFTLDAGASNLAFRLSDRGGANVFAARIADEAGNPIPDLRYLLYTCDPSAVSIGTMRASPGIAADFCTMRIIRNRLVLAITAQSSFEARFITPQGKIVRTWRGKGPGVQERAIGGLGKGLFVVKVSAGRDQFVRKVIIW